MALLTEWNMRFIEIDLAWTSLEKLLRGIDTESQLGKAIWVTFSRYTDAVAKLVGDEGDWLKWYCWENDMGANAMVAGRSKKMRHIENLKDLMWLIE